MPTANLVAATSVDFRIYKGDTAPTTLTFTNVNGDPIDLSGASILMQIKEKTGDLTSLVELSTNDLISIGGTDNNVVTILSWVDVPYSRVPLVYDMQFTLSNGRVVTYLTGKITVVIDVSR